LGHFGAFNVEYVCNLIGCFQAWTVAKLQLSILWASSDQQCCAAAATHCSLCLIIIIIIMLPNQHIALCVCNAALLESFKKHLWQLAKRGSTIMWHMMHYILERPQVNMML
jgi:hypothetical protein